MTLQNQTLFSFLTVFHSTPPRLQSVNSWPQEKVSHIRPPDEATAYQRYSGRGL